MSTAVEEVRASLADKKVTIKEERKKTAPEEVTRGGLKNTAGTASARPVEAIRVR